MSFPIYTITKFCFENDLIEDPYDLALLDGIAITSTLVVGILGLATGLSGALAITSLCISGIFIAIWIAFIITSVSVFIYSKLNRYHDPYLDELMTHTIPMPTP